MKKVSSSTLQKTLVVFAMGLLLGWVNDCFFKGYCADTMIEAGGKWVYHPDLLNILIVAVFFTIGALLVGSILWLWAKWFGIMRPPMMVIDWEKNIGYQRPWLFSDQLVLGGALLLLICLSSLIFERLF